ncbi:MAG: ribosome biogenesis GTPase Der [Pirellulaceae bacterium]
MSLPQVAIVGRPNVGKSSIFNWLAGQRLAIVDDVAGVTRDRMTRVLEYEDRYFEIIDTGGIGINDVDDLSDEIEEQISYAIATADILVFVVDTREGITALDERIAKRLRGVDVPLILVANKTDHEKYDIEANEFFRLGLGDPLLISAQNSRNKYVLLDRMCDSLGDLSDMPLQQVEEPEMKIAIVGQRNVGKSTFINTLVDSPRMIVSEVAGTTRDSVDVRFEMDGKTFVGIDTPGLRKGKSVRTDIEFYSTHRAQRSIRHADVVLMFFDASRRISKVDRQLVNYIESHYKPCILVVNKWDLMAEHMPTERWADYLRDNFTTLWNVPIAFITSTTGKNAKKMLNHAQMLYKQSRDRVSTSELNRLIRMALENHPPALTNRKRRPKIYYATQIGVAPPTIVLKCNDPDAFDNTYRRYLLGVLRDTLSFGEVPIRLVLERRGSSDQKDMIETSSSATPPTT